MDGSQESGEPLSNVLAQILVLLDCLSPLVEDFLLVGPLEVGVDWVAVSSEMEWGEVDVLGLELGSLSVFLLDLSRLLEPLVHVLGEGLSL